MACGGHYTAGMSTSIAVADELANLEPALLALPRHARAYLFEVLRLSLAAEEGEFKLSPAWEAEIARRIAAIDDGSATLIPAEEVFAELEA